MSPVGGSILITSAPKSAMTVVETGPAMKFAASMTRMPSRSRLILGGVDREQLHLEDQRRPRRNDAARAAVAVAEMRRDHELALATDTHRADAFVPSLDDTSLPDRKHERLAAIHGRVELRSALEPPGVMHTDVVAGLRTCAGTFDDVGVSEPRGRLDDLFVGHG